MVERVAGYLEQPKAAILAEMFEATLPALVNTVDALRLAKEGATREAQRVITNFGAKAVIDLQQASLDFDASLTEQEAKKRAKRKRSRGGTA